MPQLELLEDKPAHFIYSITYECVNHWCNKCDGTKCHCHCHFRKTRTGSWVRKTKADLAKEDEIMVDDGGKLPGEDKLKVEPQGFKCQCGLFAEFDSYVLAHWTVRLVWTCDQCSSKYAIQHGKAKQIRGPRKGWVPF